MSLIQPRVIVSNKKSSMVIPAVFQPHEGLSHTWGEVRDLSPNEMYAICVGSSPITQCLSANKAGRTRIRLRGSESR
jgi:hypothetical protein